MRPSLASPGTGDTRTVTVNTGAGSGNVSIELVDDDTIIDTTYSRPLGGTGAHNGDFSIGDVFVIDHDVPSVVLSTEKSPTNANPVRGDDHVQ